MVDFAAQLGHTTHIIPVPLDNMHIACNGPEVVVRLLIADVASADNLLDLSRNEKLLEALW